MRKHKVILILLVSALLVGTGFTSALERVTASSVAQNEIQMSMDSGIIFPDDLFLSTPGDSSLAQESQPAQPTMNGDSQTAAQTTAAWEARTALDVLKANPRLSDFTALVEAAGLADNLDRDGPFTVFAPTNAAMTILDTPLASEKTTATGTEILLYHVVNGRYLAPDVAKLTLLPTLMDGYIAIAVTDGKIVLNDEVVITAMDIQARNGVVHIVDTVLLPPVNSLLIADQGSREHSLAEVLAADGRFTIFLSLLEMAELTADLANLNHIYTVFAPTDAAFAQLPEEEFDKLLTDRQHRETILAYHLVGDTLGINQIANADLIPTLEGRPLIVGVDENVRVYINRQPIEAFNIVAANGVIHAVNRVLLP
jgi:transforming growth factor-beta-induced protein